MMRIVMLVLVSASFLTSCHKPSGKQVKYIPKDAYVVFSVNSKNIIDKVSKANVSFDSLAKMFSDGNDSSAQKAINKWDDLKSSGIDFDQPMYGFFKSGGSIMAGQSYATGFISVLKDAAAFEAFIKKQHPGADVKKGDNYSYYPLGNDNIAGWNDEVAIVASKHAGSDAPGTYSTGEGTLSQQMLTALFAQKESESISSAEGFSEMKNDNTDMAFFVNSVNSPGLSMLDMTKMSDLTKGSYVTGTANFEDGQIAVSYSGHTSDAMADLLKKYPFRSIDMSVIDKYPAQIEGLMAMSFDPQFIPAVLKYSGMDALTNQGLQQTGLNITLDDIIKAFKGDFAFIGSDFGMETKTISEYGGTKLPQPVTSKVPSYKLLVNAAIADKTSYDKMAMALASKNIMVLQNGQYVFPQMSPFVMKTTDKNLYIASSADILQQYETGTPKANLPADVHDMIKGKVGAFYFDINKILQVIPTTAGDQGSLDTAKATFKDFVFTADNLEGKKNTGNMLLRFVNNKENSLVTLLHFSIAERKMEMERRKNNSGMEGMMRDSTATPGP